MLSLFFHPKLVKSTQLIDASIEISTQLTILTVLHTLSIRLQMTGFKEVYICIDKQRNYLFLKHFDFILYLYYYYSFRKRERKNVILYIKKECWVEFFMKFTDSFFQLNQNNIRLSMIFPSTLNATEVPIAHNYL